LLDIVIPGESSDIHQGVVQQPTRHPASQSTPVVQPSNYEIRNHESSCKKHSKFQEVVYYQTSQDTDKKLIISHECTTVALGE